jgi:hypothetical protein
MKTYVKDNKMIFEITGEMLVAGLRTLGAVVEDEDAMLKHFAEHLIEDQSLGEDLLINALLDGIAERAIESGEPWITYPCGTCGGEEVVDSGGVTPWGAGVEIPCPECKSNN